MGQSLSNVIGQSSVGLLWLIAALGAVKLFKKDNIKPIYAFIPGIREYFIAVIAEREEAGRTYFMLIVLRIAVGLLAGIFDADSKIQNFWNVIVYTLAVTQVLFSIMIFISLCDVFRQKRRNAILWALFPNLMALIWGFSPKYMPQHDRELTGDIENAARISGASIEAIQNGLTVNLTDRSVMSMGRKRYLLKDIHLSIPTGHMVLLLGGSGAGKTTFLNAVTGYEKANAEIILHGRNFYNNYDNMKYDLGFVPQQDLMRLSDTVYRTLLDAAALRLPKNISREDRKKRINDVLDRLGLLSVKSSQVSKLSGGQRKRLSIALELISDPLLFILDEPDSGLDGVVARNLFERLRAIADEGKIVIVITHTPDRVIDLFDDVIVLAKDAARTGRLAYYGPINEAYKFFGKSSMEEILLSVNQKDEGGEGRADEFVEKYVSEYMLSEGSETPKQNDSIFKTG
ncbi:MAG: ABC transporter ATP-binding protein [Lachnospiraceae bacterium]|nr:ABC transporter ATP-binding protein [Lachnospiraceae bacterium]